MLPDWWDDSCLTQQDLLPDLEIRVGRFLRVSHEVVADPRLPLVPLSARAVQLRRVASVDADRLAPSIHAALRIADAIVRNLANVGAPVLPPATGLAWRESLAAPPAPLSLQTLLNDLWSRGIPVVPLDSLPSPKFQGMACVVGGRPVILVGHRHDAPERIAYLLAHEVGHIVNGHCDGDHLAVATVSDTDRGLLQCALGGAAS